MNDWYTPQRYIEAAREVMGGIKLDPASCEAANGTVGAERYYTKEDNGLMHPWQADSLWLNPPYGKTEMGGASNLAYFTQYLLEQYACGNTKQAILLIPVNTATSWFPPLFDYAICFPSFRIRFNQADGTPSDGISFGTCFVYMGPNVERFIKVFSEFGPIVTPNGVYRRKEPARQGTLFSIHPTASF